jgi:hypothetical protein
MPDGAAVQGGANVAEGCGEGCGEGGQVPVIDLPSVDLLGELGEGVRPCRPARDDFNLDAFVHGDGSVDLDRPVDDLDCGEPGCSRMGEFPGPVTARERAPIRHPTPSRDEDR